MRVFLVIVLVHIAVSVVSAQNSIRVPKGSGAPVLIDGTFQNGEWSSARTIDAASSAKLYFKEHRGDVFIGVRSMQKAPIYVDLFLIPADGRIYNLHASMQLGERLLSGSEWTDSHPAFRWGNNIGWIANQAKRDPEKPADTPFAQSLYGHEGVEFQLRRHRFPGREWKMRIEIRSFSGDAGELIYPANSARMDHKNWVKLKLS